MNPDDAIDLGREAINTVMMVGGPILIVGVVIGLVIGMLQAMTQVQDQTVSFVPKILVMLLCIGLALPWLSQQMIDFTRSSIERPVVGMPFRQSDGVQRNSGDQYYNEPAHFSPAPARQGNPERSPFEFETGSPTKDKTAIHGSRSQRLANGLVNEMPSNIQRFKFPDEISR